MSYYPVFLDLRDQRVLVVGGGVVGERKTRALLGSGAQICVGAPAFSPGLQDWAAAARISLLPGEYTLDWLDGVALVIAATDDAATNARVAADARARAIPVNVVDVPSLSSFIVPAVVERGDITVAIGTGGVSPVLARRARAAIERALDPALAKLAAFAARWREKVKAALPDVNVRRRFWDATFDGAIAEHVRSGRDLHADAALLATLSRDINEPQPGSVTLVGAGPGDPGLLTLHALQALERADVLLYDALVSDEVLNLARRDAERISVGKRAGGHQVAQKDTNRLLVELARQGKHVVRLKGGDAFIFGRGGEEIAILREAGITYRVVPGITAALACAAYAGIPLTHRDHAQAVQFVTAHCKQSADTLDWAALARPRQTVAFYMGVSSLQHIGTQLTGHGRDADTPFAIIERGSTAHQRVLRGRLADLVDGFEVEHGVQTPALLVVGEVTALADELHWFGAAPLPVQPRRLASAA